LANATVGTANFFTRSTSFLSAGVSGIKTFIDMSHESSAISHGDIEGAKKYHAMVLADKEAVLSSEDSAFKGTIFANDSIGHNLVGQEVLDEIKRRTKGSSGALTPSEINKYLGEAKAVYPDVPSNILYGIAAEESSFNPGAVNKESGASGLMQFMPETAKRLGVTNSFDPEQSIIGAAKLMHGLLADNGGEMPTALAQYGGYKTKDPTSYIDDVLRNSNKAISSDTIHIENINVSLPPGTPQEHVDKIVEIIHQQRNQANSDLTAVQSNMVF
jgi:hypothetical protein